MIDGTVFDDSIISIIWIKYLYNLLLVYAFRFLEVLSLVKTFLSHCNVFSTGQPVALLSGPKYERVLPSQISSLPPPLLSSIINALFIYGRQLACVRFEHVCLAYVTERVKDLKSHCAFNQPLVCVCVCVGECVLEWVWRYSNTAITDKLIIQSYCRWCKTDEGTQGYTVSFFHYIREVIERNSMKQRAWWWLHQTNICQKCDWKSTSRSLSTRAVFFVFIQTPVSNYYFSVCGLSSATEMLF